MYLPVLKDKSENATNKILLPMMMRPAFYLFMLFVEVHRFIATLLLIIAEIYLGIKYYLATKKEKKEKYIVEYGERVSATIKHISLNSIEPQVHRNQAHKDRNNYTVIAQYDGFDFTFKVTIFQKDAFMLTEGATVEVYRDSLDPRKYVVNTMKISPIVAPKVDQPITHQPIHNTIQKVQEAPTYYQSINSGTMTEKSDIPRTYYISSIYQQGNPITISSYVFLFVLLILCIGVCIYMNTRESFIGGSVLTAILLTLLIKYKINYPRFKLKYGGKKLTARLTTINFQRQFTTGNYRKKDKRGYKNSKKTDWYIYTITAEYEDYKFTRDICLEKDNIAALTIGATIEVYVDIFDSSQYWMDQNSFQPTHNTPVPYAFIPPLNKMIIHLPKWMNSIDTAIFNILHKSSGLV